MTQIIYGDVLFVVNFAMDFLALYITGSLLGRRRHTWLIVLAACIGAVYAVISLFVGGNALLETLIGASVALLMVYIAYGGKGMVSTALTFVGVNLLIGGAVTAVGRFMTEHRGVLINGEVSTVYSDIPPLWLIGVALISALLSLVIGRIRSRCAKTARVDVTLCGRSVTFDAIVDSGNMLVEPFCGRRAAVASREIMASVIPPTIIDDFCACRFDRAAETDAALVRRMRLIPAETVAQGTLLPAISCDRFAVDGREYDLLLALGSMNGRTAVIPPL